MSDAKVTRPTVVPIRPVDEECAACQGAGGYYIRGPVDMDWDPCLRCGGRGLLPLRDPERAARIRAEALHYLDPIPAPEEAGEPKP